MKVKICYTVEVDEIDRRRMRAYYGKSGLATRKDIQSWFRTFGESMKDDINEIQIEEEVEGEPAQQSVQADGAYCDCEVPTPSTTKFCHFCYRPVAPRN